MIPAVARHRTAMSRASLSRPLTQALADQVLTPDGSVFDYGCGKGDDLRHLSALGISATGWDPVHRPGQQRMHADLVNLGYVVNVIEEPAERAEVLRRAWELAERVLVVSARLTWDARDLAGRPLRDGMITRTGTFQKFYEHTELAAWIEQTLGEAPLAAAPGIFYVFREPADAQQFLASRVSAYRPRVRIDPHALYEAHRELLAPLADFLTGHARPPRDDELPAEVSARLRDVFGGLGRACQLIRRVTDDDHWAEVTDARRADLLVYIGLSRFGRRPRLSQLPATLARDIKALFGSYQAACAQADRLLFAAGKTDLIDLAACSSPVGKLTPSALYIHRSAMPLLPPLLRLYEGCAQALVRNRRRSQHHQAVRDRPAGLLPVLPALRPRRSPHALRGCHGQPKQAHRRLPGLQPFRQPALLHRKEEFIAADYPRRALWEKLTHAEIRAGLYEHPERIGTLQGWRDTLAAAGVTVRGHRLTRNRPVFTEPGQ